MQLRLRMVLVLAVVFLLSLLAGGCGHVPVTTMYKLWSFDFAVADPGAIRAAIRVPAALAPKPGGAKLTLEHGGVTDTFILEEVADRQELALLSPYARSGHPVTAYRLAPGDVKRLKDLQKDINARRAAGDSKAAGKLAVGIEACRRKALPEGALLSSTYLKLDAEAGYMPLVEDVDLRKEIPPDALAKQVPPCAPAG